MRDLLIFEEEIKTHFEPLARELGLPLVRVSDGIYDIPSQFIILRIRLHTGHARGLNLILRKPQFVRFDENVPGIQYGIGNWISHAGDPMENTFITVDNDESFRAQARLFKEATVKYVVPYLLGKGEDFELIEKQANERIEAGTKKLLNSPFGKWLSDQTRKPKVL